jgi:hypothetical protein
VDRTAFEKPFHDIAPSMREVILRGSDLAAVASVPETTGEMGSAQRGSGLDTCGRLHHPERCFMPELGFCAPRDLKQWHAEKARWGTDLDTRLRLAIKLVKPLVGTKFDEMRKRWYGEGHREVVKDRL